MPGRRLAASQVRLISVARRQLGLEDGDYRAILRRVAGVSSATALDQAGLDRVVAELERLGSGAARRSSATGPALPRRRRWPSCAISGGNILPARATI